MIYHKQGGRQIIIKWQNERPAYKNVFPEIYSEVVVFVPDDPSYSPQGKVRKGLFSTHPLYEAGETQENKIVNIGIQGRGTKCPLTN